MKAPGDLNRSPTHRRLAQQISDGTVSDTVLAGTSGGEAHIFTAHNVVAMETIHADRALDEQGFWSARETRSDVCTAAPSSVLGGEEFGDLSELAFLPA